MLPSLLADLNVPTISSDVSTAVCCADEKVNCLRPSNVSQCLATSSFVSLRLPLSPSSPYASVKGRFCQVDVLSPGSGSQALVFTCPPYPPYPPSSLPVGQKRRTCLRPQPHSSSWNNSCENKESGKCVTHDGLPFSQKCHTHPIFCLHGLMSRKLQERSTSHETKKSNLQKMVIL